MGARQRWDKKNKINNSPSPSVTRGFFVTHLCRAPIWSHFNSKVCFLRRWKRLLKENKAYKGLVKAACRTASVTLRVSRPFSPVYKIIIIIWRQFLSDVCFIWRQVIRRCQNVTQFVSDVKTSLDVAIFLTIFKIHHIVYQSTQNFMLISKEWSTHLKKNKVTSYALRSEKQNKKKETTSIFFNMRGIHGHNENNTS